MFVSPPNVDEAMSHEVFEATSNSLLALGQVLMLAALLFVSVWVGRYATHRIAGRELWWVLGTIFAYSLASSAISAYRFTKYDMMDPMSWEFFLMGWLTSTGALCVAGLMGHRFGRRTEAQFALAYVFKRLSRESQAHLLELAASVALDRRKSAEEEKEG